MLFWPHIIFNLGAMFVTLGVYKHLSVERTATDNSPVFFGPAFLHGHSTQKVYHQFFEALASELKDDDCSKLVLGSDDETALRNAMKQAFPHSKQIVCMRHLIGNVKQYLQDKVVISKKERDWIVSNITSLVSADNSIVMDEQVTNILEWCREHAPSFEKYFSSRVVPLVEKNLIGTDVPSWTNNNCESANHVLKILTQWKKKSLSELIDIMYEHVQTQYKDVERSLTGRGEYRLVPECQIYKIRTDVWIGKTLTERQKLQIIEG